jgi:hypothetical protein
MSAFGSLTVAMVTDLRDPITGFGIEIEGI